MVTVSPFLDTRREKKSKKFPLKMRVIFQREVRYYSCDLDLSVSEYERIVAGGKLPGALREINTRIIELLSHANQIVRKMKPFSFFAFERKMGQKSGDKDLVETLYKEYLKMLTDQGRVNTADNYKGGLTSLLSFRKNLRFHDISVDFLNQYESWMLKDNKHSPTTVGIYLRPLRAVYNYAIREGIVSKDNYPFGKGRYQIPLGKNIKKALSITEIGKIYYYEPLTHYEQEERAKAFWLFSYFASGMNIKDIALLQYKNIDGDYLIFNRAKTIRTTRSKPQSISVFINDDMKKIIDRWGTPNEEPEDYIFPILIHGLTPVQQRDRIKTFTKNVNAWMKDIALNLEILKPVTTYVARHSFSTVLKHSGASIEFISESLGHSNIKTTENYLGSFENETKKHFSEKLSSFKK